MEKSVYSKSKIVTDIDKLKIPCEKVTDKKLGEDIANELFRELTEFKDAGIGLAANQIGILKRVCVVNVKKPLYFVNPIITPVDEDGKFVFLETCLSMPLIVARTSRWRTIQISADNLDKEITYSIVHIPQDSIMQSSDALEVACIQHEVDHLDGMLMQARAYIDVPIHAVYEHGRNDKVFIINEKERQQIKYKHFDKFKNSGWTIEQ